MPKSTRNACARKLDAKATMWASVSDKDCPRFDACDWPCAREPTYADARSAVGG